MPHRPASRNIVAAGSPRSARERGRGGDHTRPRAGGTVTRHGPHRHPVPPPGDLASRVGELEQAAAGRAGHIHRLRRDGLGAVGRLGPRARPAAQGEHRARDHQRRPHQPPRRRTALAMGALWLPAAMIGVRFGGWRPLGPTYSVTTRPRRDLIRHLGVWVVVAGLAAVALAAVVGVITGSPELAGSPATEGSSIGAGQLILVLAVALVLGPVQAAGLELTFRGVLLQALGTGLRSPLPPILLMTAVTLIGRELTVAVLIPALALALSAGVLAWKSGGLELPVMLTTTVTISSIASAALASGTGAGAGTAALVAASAAPGTSAAGLTVADGTAALAGGIAAALTLLVLTAVLITLISRHFGLALLQPVTRPATAPTPEAVPH